MGYKDPHITVLMPVYNAEKYIHEAIASVLTQTFEDFELLIINDGSTDGTLQIIQSFDDPRIVVVSQDNRGVAAALNVGLKLAKAPYIARFDADDICYHERLQLQYGFMLSNPEYSVIGSSADYVDAEGHYVFTNYVGGFSDEEIKALNYRVCPFIHSTVFYKKEIIVANGGYSELAYTFEDHFLWTGILQTEKVCNMQRPLIKVRLNPESITIDEKWHSPQFIEIKYNAIKNRSISLADAEALMQLAGNRLPDTIKQGSYYALCGKKFLVNNYQPAKARRHIVKAINVQPYRLNNYLLYIASYLPQSVLNLLNYGNINSFKPAAQTV